MNIHKNARLTPHGRELLVRQMVSGQTPEAAARAAGVCPRTVRKWVARFLAEGVEGLQDRSSRPHRLHEPTPAAIVEKVEALRRQRWTGKQIAAEARRLAGDRQPHPQAPRPQSHRRAGAGRAGPPLRARASRRADPHRHQEARPLRARRPSHHRRPPGRASPAAPAGSSSTSASTMPRASPSRRSCPTRRRRAPSPSSRPPSPTTQASASPSRAS